MTTIDHCKCYFLDVIFSSCVCQRYIACKHRGASLSKQLCWFQNQITHIMNIYVHDRMISIILIRVRSLFSKHMLIDNSNTWVHPSDVFHIVNYLCVIDNSNTLVHTADVFHIVNIQFISLPFINICVLLHSLVKFVVVI